MPALLGRPREFTYEKRRALLDHVAQGAAVEEAAEIVGVSLRTVQRAARRNELFDHDQQLALHAAPVDPYKLVARAARTHWRAAAWLLERTDPDRFAKRPPNSCRPATLQDVSAWLIETALEATPPDQREAVYRRMQAVADKALDVLMPDQHDVRRCLVGELPHRPLPLSDHEFAKTLRVVDDGPAPAVGVRTDCAGCLPAAAAPAPPSVGSVSDQPVGGVSDADSGCHKSLEEASVDRGQRPLPQDAGRPSSDPSNGGIMSPKMSAATKLDAAKPATPPGMSKGGPDPPAIPIDSHAAPPPSAVCSAGFHRGASASA